MSIAIAAPTVASSQAFDQPRRPLGDARLVIHGPVRIQYFDAGAGEPVVLVPGFARSSSDFNELAAALHAAGYRTLQVELRGMGASHAPTLPRATLHDFAADIAAVIDDAAAGPAHIVGRALGNRIARMAAHVHPDRVRSLTLLSAGGQFRPTRWVLVRYLLGNVALVPAKMRRRLVEPLLYADGNRMPEFLNYRARYAARSRQRYAARVAPEDNWWRGGDAPMLVLHGEHDKIAPIANARFLRESCGDRVRLVEIPAAGHALLHEQPAVIAESLVSFLGGIK